MWWRLSRWAYSQTGNQFFTRSHFENCMIWAYAFNDLDCQQYNPWLSEKKISVCPVYKAFWFNLCPTTGLLLGYKFMLWFKRDWSYFEGWGYFATYFRIGPSQVCTTASVLHMLLYWFNYRQTNLFSVPDIAALCHRQTSLPSLYSFSGHHTALWWLEMGGMVVLDSTICPASLEEKLPGHLEWAGASFQLCSVPSFLTPAADQDPSND